MFQAQIEVQQDRYEEEQQVLKDISNGTSEIQYAFDVLGVIAFLADRVESGKSASEQGALMAIQNHAEKARKALLEVGAQEYYQELV